MAKEGSGDRVLKRLQSEVTCPLCLDIFTEPKRLPCEHVYCRQCLRGLALRSITGRTISCPECRRDIPIPNNDVANFPTPLNVNRLIEMYQENLKTVEREAAAPQPATCEVHNSQPLALYCETCEKLVCRDCALLSCAKKNHRHGFVEEMVKKYHTDLDRELEPVKTLHLQMSKALKDISAAESKLENLKGEKMQQIKSTFDAISEILARERRRLAESVAKSLQEQIDLTSSKRSEVSDVLQKLENLIQSTEKASMEESSSIFLADVATKKQKIEDMKKRARSLSTVPALSLEIEMELPSPAHFKEVLQVKSFTYTKGDLLKCHLEGSVDLNTAFLPVHVTTDIALCMNPDVLKWGIFARKNINLTAQLDCCHKNSSQRITVKKITPENYSLSFTPRERGKHKLYIKHNDELICGSPISVNVSIEPDRLKITSTRDINGVAGIKCHGNKIYATVPQKYAIIIISNSSAEVVEKTSIRFPGPSEVLIDNQHIYATDDNLNRIIKMDMNGTVINSTGTEGDAPGHSTEQRQ